MSWSSPTPPKTFHPLWHHPKRQSWSPNARRIVSASDYAYTPGFPQSPPSYRPPSHNSPSWRNRDIPEFVPQTFNPQQVVSLEPGSDLLDPVNGDATPTGADLRFSFKHGLSSINCRLDWLRSPQSLSLTLRQNNENPSTLADPFNPYADHQAFNGLDAAPPSQQLNPYASDPTSSTTLPFYQQQNHLAPVSLHRPNLKQHHQLMAISFSITYMPMWVLAGRIFSPISALLMTFSYPRICVKNSRGRLIRHYRLFQVRDCNEIEVLTTDITLRFWPSCSSRRLPLACTSRH